MRFVQSATRLSRLLPSVAIGALLSSCASTGFVESQSDGEDFTFGVMVMAHGGSDEWNTHLIAAVEPLKARFPIETAFGMADAGSMEAAVRRLESQGVRQVGVVRVFVSGESWYDRTQQILGLQAGAPSWEDRDQSQERHAPTMPMGFWKVDTDLTFHVSVEGLADASEMDGVLTTRIRNLSTNPKNEVVAVIAHGPGDDDENQRWIDKITQRTVHARERLDVKDIQVFTLREDWPEKRPIAEEATRKFVGGAKTLGLSPIVVPYRVHGFGPYKNVLRELDYRADGLGLLPHPNVSKWIERQAELLKAEALSRFSAVSDDSR